MNKDEPEPQDNDKEGNKSSSEEEKGWEFGDTIGMKAGKRRNREQEN